MLVRETVCAETELTSIGTSSHCLPVSESVCEALMRPIPESWPWLSWLRKGELPLPPVTDEPATDRTMGDSKPSASGEMAMSPDATEAESGILTTRLSELEPSRSRVTLLAC